MNTKLTKNELNEILGGSNEIEPTELDDLTRRNVNNEVNCNCTKNNKSSVANINNVCACHCTCG